MTEMQVVEWTRQVLGTGLEVCGPLLLAITVVGLGVSLGQALTQLQEQSLPLLAKLAVTGLILGLAGPWMMTRLLDMLVAVLERLPELAR